MRTFFARRWTVSLLAIALPLFPLVGCSSGSGRQDALTRVRDPKLSPPTRAEAVVEAWNESEGIPSEREAVRKTLKDLAWSTPVPGEIRLAAIDQLMNDTDPAGLEDSRAMARLLLPNELNRAIVTYLANLSAARDWTDMTPAIVRQWARDLPEEPDRVEERAIRKLHPGVDPARVVFGVFVDPQTDPGPYKLRWDLRTRAAAWDVLARLDTDGTLRASLLSPGADVPMPADDKTLSDLRACYSELGVVPRSGEELRWLDRLRDPKNAANVAWWNEVVSIVSGLATDQRAGLRLFHLEHVRWASTHRAEWIRASREELLSTLADRLRGRVTHERAKGVDYTKQVPERLAGQEARLSWGDALSLLVLDEAFHNGPMNQAIFAQITLDRNDRSTEYGGMITSLRQGGFAATLYPPRPSNRLGDMKFIASEDLIASSDLALSHYHFHVQKVQNREYAGPSEGDLDYAARLGRVCVVLTSLSEGVLNADAYFPGGYVIDLGEIARP